jgi:hypothetical protein
MTSQAENYDEGLGPSDVCQRRGCDGVWNVYTNEAITL